MKVPTFSELLNSALRMQRNYYREYTNAADNFQARASGVGSTECIDYFIGFVDYLVGEGVTKRDELISRLISEVVLRLDIEECRYLFSEDVQTYCDAQGWGIALNWLSCYLIEYSNAPYVA